MSETEKKEVTQEKRHFDAFISYRHCDIDSFVAKTIHRQLEAYKLPGNVSRKIKKSNPDAKTRITRVFRDEEELPLSEDLEGSIVSALENADWLIVICSPRLKESLWCKREIETFVSMHGLEHVLAVLVEGEPEDSFPEQLLYKDVKTVDKDGHIEIVRQPVEPMAADARGKNKSEIKKKIKNDFLRLCAPMFGLAYDDLKQRHREAKLKRNGMLASVIASVSVLVAIVSISAATTIRKQARQIEIQNTQLLYNQAENLAEESLDNLADDDRESAIEAAYLSLTHYGDFDMPYTDMGRYALTQSMHAYEVTDNYYQKYRMDTGGTIKYMNVSPAGKLIAASDSRGNLSVFDVANHSFLCSVQTEIEYLYNYEFKFISEEELVFIDGNALEKLNVTTGDVSEVYVADDEIIAVDYDVRNNRILMSFETGVVTADGSTYACCDVLNDIVADNISFVDDVYTAIFDLNKCVLFDSDYKEVFRTETFEYLINEASDVCIDGDDVFILSTGLSGNPNDEKYAESTVCTLKACSLATGETKWERTFYGDITQIEIAEYKDNKHLTAIDYDKVHIINEEDGTIIDTTLLEDRELVVWAGFLNERFSFITNLGYIGKFAGDTFYFDDPNLNTSIAKISNCEVVGDEILLTEDGGNDIICYGCVRSPLMESYKEDYPEYPEYGYWDRYSDGFDEIDLPYKNMIDVIITDEEIEYMFVSYSDGSIVLFSVEDEEAMYSLDADDTIEFYLGKDKEGNSYWQGDKFTYCLSPDFNLIARIEYLEAVDGENNRLIFEYCGYSYSMPVLSLEELLQMAEEEY